MSGERLLQKWSVLIWKIMLILWLSKPNLSNFNFRISTTSKKMIKLTTSPKFSKKLLTSKTIWNDLTWYCINFQIVDKEKSIFKMKFIELEWKNEIYQFLLNQSPNSVILVSLPSFLTAHEIPVTDSSCSILQLNLFAPISVPNLIPTFITETNINWLK